MHSLSLRICFAQMNYCTAFKTSNRGGGFAVLSLSHEARNKKAVVVNPSPDGVDCVPCLVWTLRGIP